MPFALAIICIKRFTVCLRSSAPQTIQEKIDKVKTVIDDDDVPPELEQTEEAEAKPDAKARAEPEAKPAPRQLEKAPTNSRKKSHLMRTAVGPGLTPENSHLIRHSGTSASHSFLTRTHSRCDP